MSDVKSWVEDSAYSRALGVEARSISDECSELCLPFNEDNSNPGGALHGGVYASLSIIGAHAAARTALGPGVGPFHTASFQINYLSAAINEAVTAKARLLRRGRDLGFVEVTCTSEAGKDVSHATLVIRGRKGAEANIGPASKGDEGGNDPGPMGPMVAESVPFIRNRGIVFEHMAGGCSRLVMPWKEDHGDKASGGTHEGAVLALLDTAGAMAAWAVTGPGPYKASTTSMQTQVLATPPAQDLVAYGKATYQDNEIFYSDVEVAGTLDNKVCARGTVIYRIVT